MGLILLLTIIVLPLAEIALFIAAGERIGIAPVVGATVLTAVIGLAVARAQGVGTIGRVRAAMAAGRAPVAELLDGALIAFAGLMLLIPGFLSDGVGALLLIAPLRRLVAARIAASVRHEEGTLEGEYRTVDPGRGRITVRDDDGAGP